MKGVESSRKIRGGEINVYACDALFIIGSNNSRNNEEDKNPRRSSSTRARVQNSSDRKRSRWNFRFCSVQSELYGLIRANGSNASFFYTSSENTTTKERSGFHERPWRMCDKILQGYVTNDNNQGSPSAASQIIRPTFNADPWKRETILRNPKVKKRRATSNVIREFENKDNLETSMIEYNSK